MRVRIRAPARDGSTSVGNGIDTAFIGDAGMLAGVLAASMVGMLGALGIGGFLWACLRAAS